jgi:hypothetical protein
MSDLRFVYGLHALFHKLSLQLVYVVLPGVPNGTIKFLTSHLDHLIVPFSGGFKVAA